MSVKYVTPASGRDTSRDGFRNKLEDTILTGFEPLWAFVNGQPWLARWINWFLVRNAVGKAPARPLALSTKTSWTSWASLTDKTYFARYLPPREPDGLPPETAVAELFKVGPEGPRLSQRSTLLFPIFAQWFTDGFLVTNDADRTRTGTNHLIDLSQVYGLHPAITAALRQPAGAGGKGRLKAETTADGEWAPRLFAADGTRKPEFADVPDPTKMPAALPADRKAAIFAFGGERANSTTYTAAINTLFLREHNRLAGLLEAAYPAWDEDRVFETARAINIVLLIKIVVEEYINHISPYWFRLSSDPRPCYTAPWNRETWIPVEFNLLYRWHSLVPDRVSWGGQILDMGEARFDNRRLLADGIGAALDSATRTKAWRFGLFNTADFMLPVEAASVTQGRSNKLARYNDYRETMQYPRVTRFEQISGDARVVEALKQLYRSVDDVEFFIGLLAEDPSPRAAVPPLIVRMVAADAFSHALTNPLLSPAVFNATTFSPLGMQVIETTSTLNDLFLRNSPSPAPAIRISMEQEGQQAYARPPSGSDVRSQKPGNGTPPDRSVGV